MNKLTFLGVEGYPQGGRKTISILVEADEYKFLLDCGASILEQLDTAEVLANEINSVFVSHLHADHSSGLILLLYGMLMEQFEKRYINGFHTLNIVGNQKELTPLINYCKAAYPNIFSDDSPVKINIQDISPFCEARVDEKLAVSAVMMAHAIPGLAIAFSLGQKRICYTADTRRTADIDELSNGCDILICNIMGCDEETASSAGFLSATGAAELAQKSGASKLILLHLYDEDSRRIAYETARSIFVGEIIVPNDGYCVSF